MSKVALVAVAVSGVALLTTGASAKPPRRARPPVAAHETAAVPTTAPPAVPTGMMTPKEVVLRPMTPAEAEANAVWSTRAGLNIAALQCQYSPFLATLRNYNDFLRQHAEELDRARQTMTAHFKRYDGTQAQNSFDRYTTQTYNSFSTLDAQYAFCEAAADAGRVALTLRKGSLGRRSGALRDAMRAALVPVSALALLTSVPLEAQPLPPL